MKRTTICLTMITLAVLAQVRILAAAESLPEGVKVVDVEVFPESIELAHEYAYRQLLVTGRLASGEQADLTRMVKLTGPAELVAVNELGRVSPRGNGEGVITVTYGDKSLSVPVKVSGVGESYEVSYVTDVTPAMSKMGCNSGTCHGSKDGKNGFKLSLRGYDTDYDYRALTDDIAARRINRAAPGQSLMLLKATGSVPHVGGQVTEYESPYYHLLRDWIAGGLRYDRESPRVTSIRLVPENPVLPRAGMKQQIAVLATYSDGAVRDVTREAFVESGDIEVATGSSEGIVSLLRRGEAPVLVRYEGAYAATTITVMGDREGFVWQGQPQQNYVDELVDAKLKKLKINPSGLCTDAEFVRRVYLDLTGLPPTVQQTLAFLDDPRESKVKRDALVDELVGSGEYVEHWTNKWADLLQVNRKFIGEEGALTLRNWIKQQIAENRPYDEFAFDVLTASGSNRENPPASYWKTLRDADAAMENSTHLFLAVRFNCNKCHDHPFERWTQDQYYQMSAFFAQVGLKEDPVFAGKTIGGSAVEGKKPLVEIVYDKDSGEMKHLRTGQVAEPIFPYQDEMVSREGARRERLAKWMTSAENEYFASSFVNRQWGYLLGRGIIEPIDDIRAGNPPTNPELLDALTKDFIEQGFDTQHIHRVICKSRVYQQSVATNKWNEGDTLNYSHAVARRLPAEVLYDAIHVATGATTRLPGVPQGFRAARLPDVGAKVPFLDDFGRPVRESSCECERTDGMVLGPVMKLINGPTVATAIADSDNALTKLAAEEDDAVLIDRMFLRFLSRHATDEEIERCRVFLTPEGDDVKNARLVGVQDLAWALINNSAFLFNR